MNKDVQLKTDLLITPILHITEMQSSLEITGHNLLSTITNKIEQF